MKKYLLNEAIKEVMVMMAMDDNFPMDISSLDIHSIVEQAEKDLAKNPLYIRECKLEKLNEFVVPDEEISLAQMLDNLEGVSDKTDNAGWIDGVQMCERYETSFTVRDLLEEIS